MKRRITRIYYKTVMGAILAVIFLWLFLTYCFMYFSKTDEFLPQTLILTIDREISIQENQVTISAKGQERLDQYHLWMQIVDDKGNVIFQRHAPEDVPVHYTTYELIHYSLDSNALGEYTIYTMPLEEPEAYGVIIGCDSSLVSKISISITGNGRDELIQTAIILVIVMISVIVAVSFIFRKKIATPVNAMVEGISDMERDNYKSTVLKKSVFQDVFIQLDHLDQSLKQGKKMRTEWIANISHDLKTPLSTIRGYAEIMNHPEYSIDKEELKFYAVEIAKAEKHMEELIEELKVSQMLEEGSYPLRREDCNMKQLLEESIHEIDTLTIGRLEIILQAEENVFFDCDWKLMKRAIQNILCNALIHNCEGVQVKVTMYRQEKHIQIVIADNGCGIPKEELLHIFKRYYRGTNSGKTKGTGLGLAIARDTVSAHGGEIIVKSEIGQGTEFQITL